MCYKSFITVSFIKTVLLFIFQSSKQYDIFVNMNTTIRCKELRRSASDRVLSLSSSMPVKDAAVPVGDWTAASKVIENIHVT